jgi:hypothetical protein
VRAICLHETESEEVGRMEAVETKEVMKVMEDGDLVR